MLRHVLAATVAGALLCSVPVAADAASDSHTRTTATSITGTWKGGVYGDDGGSAGYPAKVTIAKRNGQLSGRIVYPSVCSGKWVFEGKRNGWFRFREVITRDPGAASCVSPVGVKARRDGAKLRVVWREPTTGDTGHMLAHRV